MRFEDHKSSPRDITARLASVEAPSSSSSSSKKKEHCGVSARSLGTGLPPPEERRGPARARPGNGLRESLGGRRSAEDRTGKEGVGPLVPGPRAPRAPRAPARVRAAGGSPASRTSGCCLVAAAAAARLWSPGRRRRRRSGPEPGATSPPWPASKL